MTSDTENFRTRYGITNPEPTKVQVWELAIRNEWTGYQLRQHLGLEPDDQDFCQDFSLSAYREATPGPPWSWERFGRTSTHLPDGRIVHIAGEHEDYYDPDFCIYNDVVVERPDGRLEICLYPQDVLPPTDFHSATLVGDDIILIGSLGYTDLRRPGETQVLKLDTRTLHIAPVVTSGDNPGWLSRHVAELCGPNRIVVVGGNTAGEDDYEPNTDVFELDLSDMTWRRGRHGDTTVFPIAGADYHELKNPRYGTSNPERCDNPLWIEMARRQWTPSRARLHYGDYAPARPDPPDLSNADPTPEYGTPEFDAWMARITAKLDEGKLKRSVDEIVWTAVREDAANLTLDDGRRLRIGGEVTDYGDDYADPWIYNDVVVWGTNGSVDIYSYPPDVFPLLWNPVGVAAADKVYIFGITATANPSIEPRKQVVLQLDTGTFELATVPTRPPTAAVILCDTLEIFPGDRVVFPLQRQNENDPEMGIAFNLKTHEWSQPFPFAHPA